MAAYGHTWQNHHVGTNPHVVAYDHRLGAHALLVYPFGGVAEVVVQGRHRDALRQVDVVANADRADDGVVEADARVVANDDVAHGIVDAAIRLHHASPAQCKLAIGWGVHPHATVYLRPTSTVLVEWRHQPDVPSGTCIPLVHDEIVQPSLQAWTRFEALA